MTHKSLSLLVAPSFFLLKNTCFYNETESAWNRKKMKERVRGQSMHAKHPSESDIYVRILWQGRRNEWRCVMHPLPLVKWEAKRLKMGVFFFLPNLNRVSRERNEEIGLVPVYGMCDSCFCLSLQFLLFHPQDWTVSSELCLRINSPLIFHPLYLIRVSLFSFIFIPVLFSIPVMKTTVMECEFKRRPSPREGMNRTKTWHWDRNEN